MMFDQQKLTTQMMVVEAYEGAIRQWYWGTDPGDALDDYPLSLESIIKSTRVLRSRWAVKSFARPYRHKRPLKPMT